MKQRLLVMNGQRLVQTEQAGKWETVKVEKAGSVKPGIYNLHLSSQAEREKSYDGPILHTDKEYVYQQVGKNYVKHVRALLDQVPDIGSNSSVSYNKTQAVVRPSSSIKHTRRI